jgi:CubicO group peptidase (beta-lactamase class C family)
MFLFHGDRRYTRRDCVVNSLFVRFCSLLLIVVALMPSVAQAQEADISPAEQRLTAWLEVINAGDTEALAAFIADSYSPDALSAIPAPIRTAVESDFMRSRPWTVHRIDVSSDTQVSAVLYSELTETWVQVDLEVSADAPYLIEMLGVRPAPAPTDAPAQPLLSDDELAAYLEDYLGRLTEAGLFSGAVLVAMDDEVLYEGAFGLADRENEIPNQPDTKFNLGSMNKMFTAVAIAQLVEQGELAFDDLVSKYLPDLPEEIASSVTIEHLLTHTSGLAEFFASPLWPEIQDNPDTVSGYFPLFIDRPLQFEPGARHQYSNSNFIMLGAIIEAVSGQDYFDYIREHIYEPAGMTDTDSYSKDIEVENLAVGYTRSDATGRRMIGAQEQPNNALLPMRGSPAGGGYSTLNDLYRFAQAIRDGTLLSEDSVAILTTGKVDAGIGPDIQYAYGFIDRDVNGSRIIGHGGGFQGVSSNLDIYVDDGYTVVVLSNIDMGEQTVSNKIRELLTAG